MDKQAVQSREDLIGHIFGLLDDYDAVGDQWENKDIYTFLQALAAWLNDCEAYYRNTGQPLDTELPSW
ncbi:MAG: hypothetical protein KY476_05360 [Planctomycetes bacterium]|nr:hypothetical protein [Planctomycetota bacterium]